ncbi:hypothetical protein [uncultured Paludibaculum sp.]|uniref:hypothetical protein n=1 Tax=uncultured Paludibaculum sp. TaxID=1765020 RepID=UPI002AAB7F70|nr:hypothetical protein [uncultured Paludibaculum sp.]
MSALRSKLAALALCCVLLPSGGLLALWAQGTPTACGMQCCRRAARCCCRKDTHESSGPAWRAQNRCPGGCRLAPMVRGAAALAPAPAAGEVVRTFAVVTGVVRTPARDSSPLTRRGRAPPSV